METLQIYQQIPDLIPIIIFEGSELEKCVARNDETEDETDDDSSPGLWQRPDRIGCIKREGFEEGIPIWKSFAFHFWQHPASPIGSNWTLSPEDYEAWQPGRGNNYLGEQNPTTPTVHSSSGYSIEDRCTQVPVYDEREHRALILAKNVEMLQGEDFAWSGLLETVAKELPKADNKPFEFVSTAGKSVEQGGPQPLPEKGVVSMGSMPQIKWWHEVAKSKAMVSGTKRRSPLQALTISSVSVGHSCRRRVSISTVQ
jgi:DNA mismatch repair protein MSH3